jgi:hypothetical protein
MILTGFLDWFTPARAVGAVAGRPEQSTEDGRLRAVPREEIHLFVKHFDNTRVVRVVDRGDKAASLGSATAATLVAALMIVMLMPGAYHLVTSKRIAALRAERELLLDRLNTARARNAELKDPRRLKEWGGERYVPAPANALFFGGTQQGDTRAAALPGR